MAVQASFGKAPDIIDADYVVITGNAPDVNERNSGRRKLPATGSGLEMLRHRSFREAPESARNGSAFWAIGLLVAGAAFWISGGHALLDTAAQSPNIQISGWTSKIGNAGINATLMIDGEIVNTGQHAEHLPALQINVASPNGTTTRYKLGTGDASIDAQGTFPFSGRLHLPNDGVKTVSVSFAQ